MDRRMRCLGTLLLFSLVVMAALLAAVPQAQQDLNALTEEVVSLSQGWELAAADGTYEPVALPVRLDGAQGPVTLRRGLPACQADACLMLTTGYQTVQVAVDGQTVYRGGYDQCPPFGQEIGNLYSIVPLGAGPEGRVLTITYGPHYHGGGLLLREVLLGGRARLMMDELKSHLSVFALCFCLGLSGILFLLFTIVISARSAGKVQSDFLCLGTAMLLVSAWILTDATPITLFVGGDNTLFLVSVYCFTLMGVPLLLFARNLLEHGRRLMDALAALMMLNFLVQSALYAANLVPMLNMLTITHLLMACAIVALAVLRLREQFVYKKKAVRWINWGLYALSGCSAVALIMFYLDATSAYSVAFRVGISLFILMLCASLIQRSVQVARRSAQAEMYRNLAYTDMMTGLENRTAYERMLGHLIESETGWVGFAMFDLNRLKETNDRLGHRAGDEKLIAAGRIIKEAFGPVAHCYRIGGDEFAAVVDGARDEAIQRRLNKLQELLDGHNRTLRGLNQVHLSHGYACGPVPTPEALTALISQADQAMYQQKRRAAGA